MKTPVTHPVICLMGPTATGKTELAVALAERLPVEIVSVDSALVYRGMDIGTAKPDPAIRERVPHHLIDIAEPEERYSAGRFQADASAAIEAIQGRGRHPLLVGGTMLYFRALLDGIAPMPPADSAVREALEAELAERGSARLHAELRRVDPASAERIHPNDPQRIQRALEVWRLTGQPITAWQASGEPWPQPTVQIALTPAHRERLHERIVTRFHAMLAAGLVDEVAALRQRPGLHAELPAMRAVGYRQVWRYLDGELGHDDMVEQAVIATRQLAKRQLTWLRRFDQATAFDSETTTARDLAAHVARVVTA